MDSYMTDKRLKDYKDFTHHSKYAGTYMENQELYNNAKPFIHLKLDQACRKSKPTDTEFDKFDYVFYFADNELTLGLNLITTKEESVALLYSWQHKVAEIIDSLAIKEFGATDAFPEDEKLSSMLKDLAIKLENLNPSKSDDGYFLTVTVTF